MDELLVQFIVEARELVQAAIDDLFVLEREPENAGRLDSAFRAVHTLKGATGLFDMAALQSVLHRAEDNLGRVRSGSAALDGAQVDAVIAALEWIDNCVDDIESNGAVGTALLHRAEPLKAALGSDANTPKPNDARSDRSIGWALVLAEKIGGRPALALRYRPHPECFFNGDDPIARIGSVPSLLHVSITPREPWPAPDRFDPYRSNLIFEALSGAPLADIETIFRLVPDQVEIVPLGAALASQSEEALTAPVTADATRSLTVDPARIDALLDVVGELMTTKNRVGSLISAAGALPNGAELARSIAATQKDLDRLVGSLYGAVLQTRMVPVSHAFRRLPRMVHDLAHRLGKPTELVTEGGTIEADKTIVDNLFEPLLHLVRNAMDHGIESPADRFAAGKSANAKLLLQVRRQGDQAIVSLVDDGRGVDPDAIRAVAIRKGLITADQAARLDDAAAMQLLFAAGFSTSATVNDLSGRGVGLDAVRSVVMRLGGMVDLASVRGTGTTIAMRLPVRFAMTQLMIVSVAHERYGVPMHSVVETVRVRQADITPIRGNRAFVLRDRTIPLLYLSSLLGLTEDVTPPDELTVLVLAIGDQHVGIAIDAIAERLETITRPLSGLVTGVRGIAGTTIMGDGRVLLVLDAAGLIQ